MSDHPTEAIRAVDGAHRGRTIFALVSATLISVAILTLLAVFDVR